MIIDQTNKLGYRCAGISILLMFLSLFFPIDAPVADPSARADWINSFIGSYLFAWLIQIVLLFSFSLFLAATSGILFHLFPVTAVFCWVLTIISMGVFLAAKFMAFWAVPLAAKASVTPPDLKTAALERLIQLDLSQPYSHVLTLEYLGLWLYALIMLPMIRPLFQLNTGARVAAVMFFIYGVGYHILLLGTLFSGWSATPLIQISDYLLLVLLIASLNLMVVFRKRVYK